MAFPFETSRRKIAWAEKRLEELYWELQRFQQREPYMKVIEDDPENSNNIVHKMILTEQIPESTLNLTAEIVNSLRTALDNAMFDVASATGETDPRKLHFRLLGPSKTCPMFWENVKTFQPQSTRFAVVCNPIREVMTPCGH